MPDDQITLDAEALVRVQARLPATEQSGASEQEPPQSGSRAAVSSASMAGRIGIARRWFQNKRYPHYDICKSKRAQAVKLGAIEIGRQEFVDLARRLMNGKTEQ